MIKLNKNIIIIILLFLLGGGIYFFFNMRSGLKNELRSSENLRIALNDSIKQTVNKYNEIEFEKRTLQTSFRKLTEINSELSENQKRLVERNKTLSNEKKIIASALIQARVKIDSMNKILSDVDVNISDSSMIFTSQPNTQDVTYKFLVNNVFPSKYAKPNLKIIDLELNNEQFIKFEWGERKEGYPISFSVSNSNPYFQTYDIDSYAIPQLNKEEIKPTFWQKVGDFSNSTWGKILFFGLGVGLGSQL